jgi:hypothetical protein
MRPLAIGHIGFPVERRDDEDWAFEPGTWSNTLKLVRFVLVAASLLLPLQGVAAQTVYAPGGNRALQVRVTAAVAQRCGFVSAPSGIHNQPDFSTTTWSVDFPFTLDCNVPSRVAAVSASGGLSTPGAPPAGYANKTTYDVVLNLVGNDGTAPVSAQCAAATLTQGSTCSFVGPASTSQGLRLTGPAILQGGSFVRIIGKPYAGSDLLIAGTYSDTLTVTVSPSL